MKHLLLSSSLLFVFALMAFAPAHEAELDAKGIKWLTWEEMVVLNAKNPKPILIDFYTDWCGWCKRMDKDTFGDENVGNFVNKTYYPVKFDAEQKENIEFKGTTYKFVKNGRRGYHELAAGILQGKMSYPSTVFMTSDFKIMHKQPGYVKADVFEMMSRYLLDQGGLNWEEYQKAFKEKQEAKK